MARATLGVTLGQHSLAGAHGCNQDFHGAMLPQGHLRASKGIVLAVADGIGSSQVSQVASQMAVRSFLEDYYATSEAWSVRRAAQRVLAAANSWLHAQTMASDARFDKDRGYVCTFSALILRGREAHLLHVGDARICRVHAAALEQLTEDHCRRLSPQESYLGRALGTGPNVEMDYLCWPTAVGDVYLLATDGVHEYIDAAAVQAALVQHLDDLDAAARQLVQHARDRGSVDDATVQLLRIDTLPPGDAPLAALQREGLALPPLLAPRMVFEGFTILRELQLSARSHVHLALDQASGQTVVLKTPSVDRREDAGYLDRFPLEEWVARRIDSPHVVRAWHGDRARTHLFVALEYVEGQTLAQWMVGHPGPSLDAVRDIVDQLARGLQAFHRRDMLHQDVRPENVMIDRHGTVRIVDLGSTHVAGLASAGALPDAVPGELQYAAPECLAGQAAGPPADLFSLAALTYRMLCGALPYGLAAARVRTPADIRKLHYTPLRPQRPDLPAWVDGVLQQALHPDARRRQQAVSEFAHDLRSPGPHFTQPRGVPLIERDPVVFWQATALVLAASVVVLLGLLALGRA